MLFGCQVENIMIGGPAYGKLQKGDVVLKIDGIDVNESNVLELLRGCDVPASHCLITVQRSRSGRSHLDKGHHQVMHTDIYEVLHIDLKRVSTAEVADLRRMFDLFTFFEVDCPRT